MFVWEWTLNAPKTCPGHVLQVFRDLRIVPAALEICFYLPKYLKPLENFQWIDFWILTIQTFVVCDPDIHFAPKPYATVWRSLPWTACMQIDCFFCIISVFFGKLWRRDSQREPRRIVYIGLHKEQGCTFGVKWETSATAPPWTEKSLKHSHELLNFSFLLTEVDFNLFGLFCPAVPSLFACKIVKKVEK